MDGLHVNEARMGYDHVGAQDQANANMSIVGPGVYLDPFFGNKFAMEMTSANTLQIETGAVWANGHYVDLDHAVELQIANGKTANKRHDLVCIKCTISDLGGENQVDNYDLVVLQGEQTTGTPVDPEVPTDGLTDKVAESYAVIARVSLDGLTPTVEMLLHTIPSLMTPIESWQLAAGAVNSREIANNSVGTEHLESFVFDYAADFTIGELVRGELEQSDVLRFDPNSKMSASNSTTRVIKDSSRNLAPRNLPPELSSESLVYATRKVQLLDNIACAVWLFESFPKTRIWKNFCYYYGADTASVSANWQGWELVNWDSISRVMTHDEFLNSAIWHSALDNNNIWADFSKPSGDFRVSFRFDQGQIAFFKDGKQTKTFQ